jgi:hypothetical protein
LCGPEAKVTLDGVTLRDGRYGLWDNSAAAADSIVVDNCEIANVEEAAIHLAPSSASASAPSDLRIIHTSFDMVGSPYAIVLSSSGASLGYNAVLTSFTIDNAGDSTGVAGLVLDQAGTSETQVIDCNVQNLPVGTGVRVLSHSPILIRNRVADCRTGVELRGSGTPRVASDLTSGPPGKRIWNCDTGIFIHSTGADLESLVVSVPLMNPPPNPCAIWADTVSAVSVSDCSFILSSSAVGMWSNGGDIDMVGTTMDIVGGSGLRLTGGESHVTDCTITVTDGASTNRGIKSDGAPSGSGIQIDHCFLSVPGGTGVEALTTNVNHTVEFCTVDSAGIGFHDEQGGTIRNCIATNCSTNGFETSASNKATYCIAPDGYSPSAGTGSVTEDPYYCVPGSEFTLKVDSYGNPYNNDSELQIGAYPVACMYGTLARDSKFGGGSLSVTGDATIPVAKELTLLSGADVVADSTVLITASGTLRAIGDSANVVVFRGSANAPGHWDGIMTTGNEGNGGGRIVLSYAEIRDAVNCVQDDNTWPADSLYLAHVSMSSFSNAAVNAVPFFSNNSADLGLDHCTIDMTGAPYGIRINRDDLSSQTLPSYKVVVQNTTITGDGSGTYGVYLDAEAQGGQKDAKVQNLRISGLTAGTGIYVEDLSPSLFATRNDSIVISNCKWGIQLHGDGAPDLDVEVPPIGNDGLFRIEGCTEGLLVEDTCSPEVSSITIKSLVDTGYGLHTRDSAGGTYTGLTITRGWYGVRAWSDAAQEIRSSAITDFSQYGVGVSSTGLMDLGDAPGDPGNNNIHSNSTTYSTVFYVGVKNRVAELGDVPAESNWWGEYPPPSSKFSAAVDYDPAIVLDPTLASDRVAFVVIPPHATLMARPNPFRQGGAVIEYGVPEGVGPVRLELFDVSGRRVRALLDGESPPGYHTVSWDGRDSSGRETATGIYFIRFQAGDQVKTTKLVRVW